MTLEERLDALEKGQARIDDKLELIVTLLVDPTEYFKILVESKVEGLNYYEGCYIAADNDGSVYAYKEKPRYSTSLSSWSSPEAFTCCAKIDMTGLKPAECIFYLEETV